MKFECKKCGKCCNYNGNLPLFEWEAEKLIETAKEKNIKINLKPIDVFLDKQSGIAFYVQLGLFGASCPFLINNSCSVYHDRFLICKAYPLLENYFLEKNKRVKLSNQCSGLDENFVSQFQKENQQKTEIEDAGKFYHEVFGESFLYSLQYNSIKLFFTAYIDRLIKENKIKIKRIDKFDAVKYEPVSFLKFLEKKGLINEEGQSILLSILKDEKNLNKLVQLKNNLGL